jgi:hypothetical protein
MPFKKGDAIRQKPVEALQGPVKDVRYDADNGEFDYLMEITLPDGTKSERWFDEGDVEAVPATPAVSE